MSRPIKSLYALALMTALASCSPQPPAKDDLAATISAQYPVVIQNIADGVWVHTSAYTLPGGVAYPSNGLIVEDGDGLTLVDTAWGEMATQSLLQKISEDIGKPVKNLIITHHHYDRMAGVDIVEKTGAKVFTHPETAGLGAAMGVPVPNTSVAALSEPKSRSKVGNIEIAFPGAGHAEDNLVVYVPSANVLFAGCAVRGADMTSLGNIADADITAWPGSLAWTKAVYKDTKIVVPSHGKGGDLSLIDKTLKMLAAEVNQKRISEEKHEEIK